MAKEQADLKDQQTNKRHNVKKDKLVQKKKFKKNKKKFMEVRARLRLIKKAKDQYRKMSVISERFGQKVHADEMHILKQIVKKLLSHNENSEEEIPEVFDGLDQGASIDISGIDDPYVQGKLFKIFKIMRLRKGKDNELEFSKKMDKEIHAFSFKKFIQYMIAEVKKEIDQEVFSEDDEDSSDGVTS